MLSTGHALQIQRFEQIESKKERKKEKDLSCKQHPLKKPGYADIRKNRF